MRLPAGYENVVVAGAHGFSRSSLTATIRDILGTADSLRRWAAAHPHRTELSGRGPSWTVPAPAPGPEAAERWVLKPYRRGGWMEGLGDRYLRGGVSRPESALLASEALRAAGVPTPAVVAGAVHPAGIFYRADLVTEMVPSATHLGRYLTDPEAQTNDHASALRAAGRLLGRLSAAGFRHADLHSGNILVRPSDSHMEVFVIDLDRGRLRPAATRWDEQVMIRRLSGSLFPSTHRESAHASRWAIDVLLAGVDEGRRGTAPAVVRD